MERWGRLVARLRWTVLVVGLLVAVLAGLYGFGVFGALSDGGFEDPDSESARADAAIAEAFGPTDADVLVLYETGDGATVDDPAVEQAVTDTVTALPDADVVKATTAWNGGGKALVSDDGESTLVALTLAGADDDAKAEAYERIADDLAAPGLTEQVGGPTAVFSDVGDQVAADIARAESLTIPIVVLLCLVVFGSIVSATLPALVGGIAIIGSFALLRVFTTVTDVSIFAINVITLLGLGLAIDYALFVVSRFREELGAGRSTPDAIARTMATAGRTVLFSGLTVAVSLASLLLFPQVFLRSMGFGGMAAVLVAMVTALTVLPALLAVLGPRVDAGRMPWRRRRDARRQAAGAGQGAEHGAWARIARVVMRRPVVVLVTVVVGLLAIGLPFLRVEWTSVDERVLPEGTESRVVSEQLDAGFPGQDESTADVVVTGADPAGLESYTTALGAVDGVDAVRVVGEQDGTTRLEVAYAADPYSVEGRDLVEQLRAVPVPDGAEALVGGEGAQLIDLLASLGDTLALDGAGGGRGHDGAAVRRVRVGRAADQGDRGQRDLGGGVVRCRRLDLPGRPPVRPAGLHPARGAGRDAADPDAGHPVRPVDGLRGVPALADTRAVGPHPRQHRLGGGRAAADRRDHHQRGAAAGRGDRGVRDVGHHVHQDDRRRHAGGDHRRRHRRTHPAGACGDAADGPGQLVGAGTARAVVGAARLPRGPGGRDRAGRPSRARQR